MEIIDIYTRQDALDDGVLIDVSDIAVKYGFSEPVAITNSVDEICETMWGDYHKNLSNVLGEAMSAFSKKAKRLVEFKVTFTKTNGVTKKTFWLTYEKDGFTIMTPDYY